MNENEKSTKRRDWVKNAAIIFLSVMLVLTFFSNTIMNYSLPEVATEYVQSGTITEKVRGTGNIEATDPYNVMISESRLVSSVAVKVGDKVEKDTPLFYLEDEESTELLEAEKELNTLMLAYQVAVITETLGVGTVSNIENDNTLSLTQKQQKLQAAVKSVDSLQAALDKANADVAAINKELGYISNTVVDTSGEKNNVSNAQKEVNNANQSLASAEAELTGAQTNKTNAEAQKTAMEAEMKTASDSVTQMQNLKNTIDGFAQDYAAKEQAKSAAQADYDKASTEYDSISADYEIWKAGAGANATAEERQQWIDLVEGRKKSRDDAKTALDTADSAVTAAKSSYDNAVASYSDAELQRRQQYAAEVENKLNVAKADVAKYTQQIQDLTNTVSQKKSDQTNKSNSLANAEQSLKDKENSIDPTVPKADASKRLLDAEDRQKKAQADFDRAKEDMASVQKELLAEINLESQNDAIGLQLEKIRKLEEKAVGATIDAPVSGTVTAINLVAGEKTKPEEALAVIQVDGKGFTLTITATTEQAKKLQVGDIAELQNAWYYDQVKVVLAAIKPDQKDPAKSKSLVFNVEGDVQAGQSLSIAVGQRSSNYELVVPNSAIREDKNGKFILTVESRNSPLGNRYIATRVDVEVLASDDTHTAISAGLYGYEYVITTATKPVEAGKQVRLTD